MSDQAQSNTGSVIDAVMKLTPVEIVDAVEGKLALVPHGKKLEDLRPFADALRDAPKRIETTAAMTNLSSFIAYLNRFKTTDTAVFAGTNPGRLTILGVLDFHGQGGEAAPRFGKHRATYNFPLSEQIKSWIAVSGRELTNDQFATLVSDRSFDIANPPLDWMQVDKGTLDTMFALLNIVGDSGDVDDTSPDADQTEDGDDRYVPRSALYKLRRIRFGSVDRLVKMARTIEIAVNAKAVEGYNPRTGERTVQFTEEHEARDGAGRKIVVPDAFLLRVPIWEGEAPVLIPVRLQYRRTSAGLKWFVTLVEWRRVVMMAVRTASARVADETTLPIFEGMPGSQPG